MSSSANCNFKDSKPMALVFVPPLQYVRRFNLSVPITFQFLLGS